MRRFLILFVVVLTIALIIGLQFDRGERSESLQGSSDSSHKTQIPLDATAHSKDPKTAKAKKPTKTSESPEASYKAILAQELSKEDIVEGIRRREAGFDALASRLPTEEVPIEAHWKVGDDWMVETYYKQMQNPGQPWTGPAMWRFRVERETNYRGRLCWELIVTRADDPKYPASLFYVTRDSQELAGMQSSILQKGSYRRFSRTPNDDPDRNDAIEAQGSIVPFDLPPLGAKARAKTTGSPSLPPFYWSKRARKRLPRDHQLIGYFGTSYDLSYKAPSDKTTIHQRWSSKDQRWPVMSRTATTWSFRRGK